MGRKAGTPGKCLICGDNACGINYNVPSCMSCKTFFRRNALRQKEATCQFSDCCTLDRITRKFCTKCRLKKCLEVGMSKEMIKSEDEKHELKEKIRLNRNKRMEDLKNVETKVKTLSPLVTTTTLATNTSPSTSKTLCTESVLVPVKSIALPGSQEPIKESTIHRDEILDSYETNSTLDDICPYLKDMGPVELSDIEVTPLGSEQQSDPNQLFPFVSSTFQSVTSLVSNSTKTNSIVNYQPDFAHLIPNFTTIHHIGLPVDELILPEQNLVLELVSASCVMHNPYKRIVDFQFGAQCHETSEYAFYRLIRMSKQLTAFDQLTSESQEQLLKNSLIPMLYMRTVVMYNQYRKAWAFVNDRSKSSVMFRVDTIKPYCNRGFERQENFPQLFRDEWKQDKAIMNLLTTIILFSPNVKNHEYGKINSEHFRYIRLLNRYLKAKYSTNSEADECFHQLMNNLQECQLLTEDIVSFFRCPQLEFRCRPFFCKLLDLDNPKHPHLMERSLSVWTD